MMKTGNIKKDDNGKNPTTIESTVGGSIAHFAGYMCQYVPRCTQILEQQETHAI